MANYKETSGTASAWRRCNRVIVDNPIDSNSSARFFEENVVSLGGARVQSDAGSLLAAYQPDEKIMLRDPATGELTGAYVTQAHLYQVMYSLYMQEATRRDLEQSASQPPAPPAPAA